MAAPPVAGSRPARPVPLGPAPAESWYVVATADEVGAALVPVTALGHSLVLFRTRDGAVAALDDCCAHRPYPLSLGRLVDDTVQCGLCGFVFDATGQCVHVPTQSRIPVGAAVRCYPTRERDGLVWAWFGAPGRADRHRVPELSWLRGEQWVGVTGEVTVAANYLLLHESFADVTKIPVLAPEVAPAALEATPPLEVVVTEKTVTLTRSYPPAALPDWQADALDVDGSATYAYEQEGHFLAPGAWVDHWDAHAGSADDAVYRLRFTQLLTPVDERATRLRWTVSRDFGHHDVRTSQRLDALFTAYYQRLGTALGRSQELYQREPVRAEVSVSADAAGLRVREIVRDLLAEEGRAARRR